MSNTLNAENNHHSLMQQTVDKIVDYIKDNNLQVGNSLPSGADFFKQLGVSRVIFREAMSYLKGLGIIESGRGSGFKIAKLDPISLYKNILPLYFSISKERFELGKLRINLELGAITEVVKNINEIQIEQLFFVVDRMEELIRKGKLKVNDYEKLDAEFHRVLSEASGCRMLELLSRLYFDDFMKAPRTRKVTDKYLEEIKESCSQHRIIATALSLRDKETAILSLSRHFEVAKDSIAEMERIANDK